MNISKSDIDACRDAVYYLQTMSKSIETPDLQVDLRRIVGSIRKLHQLLLLTKVTPPLSLDLLVHGNLADDHPFCKGVQILIDAAKKDCGN
jgi:hypothetical protein